METTQSEGPHSSVHPEEQRQLRLEGPSGQRAKKAIELGLFLSLQRVLGFET